MEGMDNEITLFFQTFRPLLSRLKLSGPILLIVLWIATLVWIWWQGADYSIDNYKPLETLTRRWLVNCSDDYHSNFLDFLANE